MYLRQVYQDVRSGTRSSLHGINEMDLKFKVMIIIYINIHVGLGGGGNIDIENRYSSVHVAELSDLYC